jgi:hypothetical protein
MRHDDEGRIVEIGARTRTIPPAIRRALQSRDHGCRFPGCEISFAQGHLVLLCRKHHQAVHEDGYHVERTADGELGFKRPDGRALPEVPLTLPITGDPAEMFRLHADGDGRCGHTKTASGTWSGECFDVGYAIDVMHPRATGETNRGPRGLTVKSPEILSALAREPVGSRLGGARSGAQLVDGRMRPS